MEPKNVVQFSLELRTLLASWQLAARTSRAHTHRHIHSSGGLDIIILSGVNLCRSRAAVGVGIIITQYRVTAMRSAIFKRRIEKRIFLVNWCRVHRISIVFLSLTTSWRMSWPSFNHQPPRLKYKNKTRRMKFKYKMNARYFSRFAFVIPGKRRWNCSECSSWILHYISWSRRVNALHRYRCTANVRAQFTVEQMNNERNVWFFLSGKSSRLHSMRFGFIPLPCAVFDRCVVVTFANKLHLKGNRLWFVKRNETRKRNNIRNVRFSWSFGRLVACLRKDTSLNAVKLT